MKFSWGKVGWLGALLVGVALLDYLWISPANQTYAKRYLNESIVLSASTYATCRVINGGVSSLQESSISISPWGVGLEYEAGQILDPINDAVERLSEACVHSMALLGAQRIVLGIINQYGLIPFYLTLVAFLLLVFLGKGRRFARLFGRLALILLLVRLSTPVLCFLGTWLNHQYFDPKIEHHTADLDKVHELAWAEFDLDVPEIAPQSTDPVTGIWGFPEFLRNIGQKISWYTEWMKKRAEALGDALRYLKENFTDILECLTGLFVLVIEKIILLAILLPLGLLYCLRKAYRWLAEEELDQLIASLFEPERNPKGETQS
jgi:hypothetical protein